jgi:hypothetical protein
MNFSVISVVILGSRFTTESTEDTEDDEDELLCDLCGDSRE